MFRIVGMILMILGLMVALLGIVIWNRQLIAYISVHSNVHKEDIKSFTKTVGQSTVGFGISIFCMGLFWTIGRMLMGLIIFLICFILSLILYYKAQSHYNTRV